jgi:hypothetical protein
MTVVIERSLTGGVVFEPSGGDTFDSLKQPADFLVALPESTNQGRVIKGRVTLFGGKWRGAAFIELDN